MKIKICMGTNCVVNGAMDLYDQIESLNELIEENPEAYKVESLELEAISCTKDCKTETHKQCVVYIDEKPVKLEARYLVEHIMDLIRKD